MTTTTNINNTNINTTTDITNIIYNNLKKIITEDIREGYNTPDFDLVDAVLRGLGFDVRLSYDLAKVDEWRDRISYRDGDEEITTHAGDLLLKAVQSYDYSYKKEDRLPRRPLKGGETIYRYGCAHIEYVGIITAPCVSDDLMEQYHLTAWRLLPTVKNEVHLAEARKRKSWGWETNLKLSAAGCNQAEVTAWWTMSWKKEVSPEVWVNFCHTCSVEQVEWALEAHSKRYLESIDMHLGSSFPRSMDIIYALAKAKGITKGRKLPKRQTLVGIPPTRVCDDGAMEWSF